jgi:glycerate dehydrogenase
MKAVFLDAATLGADIDLGPVRDQLDELVLHDHTARGQVNERIRDFDTVVTNKVVLHEEHFQANPQLRRIAVVATGLNNIDMEAARTADISVINATGYGRPAVAQHTIALMLALATRLLDYHRDVQTGRWARSPQFCLMDHPIMELQGRTLGIVGYGDLGQGVAERARAFGMKILVAARPGQAAGEVDGHSRIPLEDLLSRVDVLSLHCLLSDQTRGLIGAEELALMKPDALLLNTSRGGLVDEVALADALRAGRLGGAGFDVLSEEPPANGNPLLADDIPNLIVTPHCAWASREARQRIVNLIGNGLRRLGEGDLTHTC